MSQTTNQLTLSYELLCLLQWLVEHESEALKNLIARAFNKGLKNVLKDVNNTAPDFISAEDMHYNVIDFLGLMEELLNEIKNEQRMKTILRKKLMPAIDHIDAKVLDFDMVQSSVEQASLAFENNPEQNPQELLLQTLLKSWNPSKKSIAH